MLAAYTAVQGNGLHDPVQRMMPKLLLRLSNPLACWKPAGLFLKRMNQNETSTSPTAHQAPIPCPSPVHTQFRGRNHRVPKINTGFMQKV